jgi:hypothetical protein
MFKVTYSYYRKYTHEKTFKTYEDARKFFWIISKKIGVTKTEICPIS